MEDIMERLVPEDTKAWVLTDGKIGDEVQCFGIMDALGAAAERRLIAPRRPWSWITPYGPVDPAEKPTCPGSPIAPPFPDIVIAAGRRTVPYLRHVKHASTGRSFTIFVKDPYTGLGTADVIWLPEHDKLRGANTVVTLTPAHRFRPHLIANARANPDPRIALLRRPRVAILLGGNSVMNFRFERIDTEGLAAVAAKLAIDGHGVMVTPSRRTPPQMVHSIERALSGAGRTDSAFIWDGSGENPYLQMLANADAIIVTGDSVNMVGEATATGAPVHVYTPSGKGHSKLTRYIDKLVELGAVRRWSGALESFSYEPIDSAPVIARAIAKRYEAFRSAIMQGPGV